MWDKLRGALSRLSPYRYVLLTAAVGLVLLLWPSSGRTTAGEGGDLSEETRIAQLLTDMDGVGSAEVLLSDCGAVVVCTGADDPSVCLRVTQAVKCYTGLGADDVRIFKSAIDGG